MIKSVFRYAILSLMVIGILSSCVKKNARENNFPEPPYKPLPAGDTITIDSLLRLWHEESSHKFTTDTYVIGTVTGDETSGNLYKAAFIQDPEDGSAIELYMKSTCGLRIGDIVAVYLKGATVSEYSGTPQVQDLDPKYITILDNEKFIQPEVIKITDVYNYLCRLVTFENVQFIKEDLGLTYADADGYGERTIEQQDLDGNISTVIARTSNYASFAEKEIARGNGSFTGIVTLYASGSTMTWQMVIRSINELNMNGTRFGGSGTGTEDDPYDVSSAMTIQNDTAWVHGYIVGAAQATTIVTNSDVQWEAPFTLVGPSGATVVIANNQEERNINKCLVVYLPNNNPYEIRQLVNLIDHPENLHKMLKVKGQLKEQYGWPGLKAYDRFEIEQK